MKKLPGEVMFCKRCGRELLDGEKFCPECGTVVDDNISITQNMKGDPNYRTDLIIFGLFCFVWVAITFTMAIDGLTVDLVKEFNNLLTPEIIQQLKEQGLTDADIQNLIFDMANITKMFCFVLLISGIFALIGGILCVLRRWYTIALISVVTSSILGLVVLLGIVGLLFAYLIYKSKSGFADEMPSFKHSG